MDKLIVRIDSVNDRYFELDESENTIETIEKGIYAGDYWVPYITGLKLYVNGELYKDYFKDERFLGEI